MTRQVVTIGGAAVVLACVCLLILAVGPSLRPEASVRASVAPPAAAGTAVGEPAAESVETPSPAAQVQETQLDDVPALQPERAPAREPLSELSLALPPKPAAPGEWKPTVLPRPVSNAAGLIEAKGYRIALAGIEPVDASEQCTSAGETWPCGVGARTAFRAFLRGRSVACVVPPEPERETIVAPCTVGKQDVAAWLVENGWVRALPDGDYVALGEAATRSGKGLFGKPPPSTAPPPAALDSALPRPPPVTDSVLVPTSPEPDATGEGQAGMPPAPAGDFPRPPAPPPAPVQ